MESIIWLLVLLLLAFPVLAIVALVMAVGTRDRVRVIEVQLLSIANRLDRFAVPGVAAPAAQPTTPPVAEAPPVETPPVVEPTPAAATPPPTVTAPAADAPGFEERFGTRWVVRIGGLALALGGIFLVRYSIEQGLIGPGARIALGGLLAACLIAAGEWTRRQERITGPAGIPTAHIPSILTAAGTTVAFATVYAAYGIYDFLSPGAAFVLLGIVALLTLAAALLHGPALAALGLVGAYVTPLLVSTNVPNYWALYIYLAVVTAAALTLARIRLWRWLAAAAVIIGALWTFPGIADPDGAALTAHAAYVVIGFVLAAALIVAGYLFGPDAEPGRVDAMSSGALGVYLFAAAALVVASHHDGAALAAFTIMAAGTVFVAWRSDAASAAVPAAGLLAALVIAHWAVELSTENLILPGGPAAGAVPEPHPAQVGSHLALGAGFALLFGAAGFLSQGRSQRPVAPMLWAATAVVAPIAILIALYYKISGFERSIPFAAIALALAAVTALATEALAKREARPGLPAATAIFATGAIAALALAMTFALEKGWLTVALALTVPGIAWVLSWRPLPILRWVAAAMVVLVVGRIIWEPRIVGTDVGTTPILNWLLYGYGVPAAAFWLGGHLLRQRADDVPSRMVDSAAILFTVLLGFLEIRHLMNGGDVYRQMSDLAELSLQVAAGLAMAIGLERVRGRTQNIVHNIGALVIAGLAALGIVLGLWLAENPLLTYTSVGGPFVNLILLGYGLNAVLVTVLALITRPTRPRVYRIIATVLAVGLALAYLSLEVTRLYHGPILTIGPTTNAEQYTYSAVWLAFGVALLLVGILLASQPTRLASAAVILITVIKVFIFDLANIEGVFRALSFIGLGVVLVGIGLLYQRLLFPPRRAPAPGAPGATTPAA